MSDTSAFPFALALGRAMESGDGALQPRPASVAAVAAAGAPSASRPARSSFDHRIQFVPASPMKRTFGAIGAHGVLR